MLGLTTPRTTAETIKLLVEQPLMAIVLFILAVVVARLTEPIRARSRNKPPAPFSHTIYWTVGIVLAMFMLGLLLQIFSPNDSMERIKKQINGVGFSIQIAHHNPENGVI